MKSRTVLFFLVFTLNGCTKTDELNVLKKYTYSEGTVLTYESDAGAEQFVVQRIVNGKYESTRSGTCGKPPLDKYYYQAIHLKAVDTLDTNLQYVPDHADDCNRYPGLNGNKLISSLNGSYQPGSYDVIRWLDEFHAKISDFNRQHESITLRKRRFLNVYEFDVIAGKRLSKIYYSTKQGFVGYALKNGIVFDLKN